MFEVVHCEYSLEMVQCCRLIMLPLGVLVVEEIPSTYSSWQRDRRGLRAQNVGARSGGKSWLSTWPRVYASSLHSPGTSTLFCFHPLKRLVLFAFFFNQCCSFGQLVTYFIKEGKKVLPLDLKFFISLAAASPQMPNVKGWFIKT